SFYHKTRQMNLSETFHNYIGDIPGRILTNTNIKLIDLLMRPAQNEGVEMQPFDEDQLIRAFRLQPGILLNYDASLLDQEDEEESTVETNLEHRHHSERKHKKKKKKRKHDREGETEEERK